MIIRVIFIVLAQLFLLVQLSIGQKKVWELAPSLSSEYGRPSIKGYPSDINSAKVCYIKVENKRKFNQVNQTAINRVIISGMEKKHKGVFQSFEPSFIEKKKDYFLGLGFKYRILMYYEDFIQYTGNGNAGMTKHEKQKYQVVIEDLSTGKLYVEGKYHWRTHVMKKFFKVIR